jgi:hypothetical protein
MLGSTLAFGGACWWFLPAAVTAASLLVLVNLVNCLVNGRILLLKSPLAFLGLMMLALSLVQLVSLPASVARFLSPTARDVYSLGVLPHLVHADDPEAVLPVAPQIRSPASINRSATVRWMVEAWVCLSIFWAVSHFTDRLSRLYLVWGLAIAGFSINSAVGIVQVSNRSDGLYGFIVPASSPTWGPTVNDLLQSPTTATLRNLPDPVPPAPTAAKAVLVPTTPFLFGTMMGGSGALLALGALALPLTLAIILHLLAPRGSRESLPSRLGQSGHGSLAILLVILLLPGTFLIGLIAGPWYCLPVILGLGIVVLPALCMPGLRALTFSLSTLLLIGMGGGLTLQGSWGLLLGGQPPVSPPNLELGQALWSQSLAMIGEFPWVGSGLGSFATVEPYFKDHDLSSTTAMSSLLQWGVEAGAVGLGIVALGVFWCIFRLPASLKGVGAVDHSLAHGLLGAVLSFSLLAVVHWTIELSAIAITASAVGGTWNRWLAGGTDLFLERG